jgi:hypothetical protein
VLVANVLTVTVACVLSWYGIRIGRVAVGVPAAYLVLPIQVRRSAGRFVTATETASTGSAVSCRTGAGSSETVQVDKPMYRPG